MISAVRSLLRYRALVQSLVSRELKARYRGSVLGFLWSFVNPLLQPYVAMRGLAEGVVGIKDLG